MFISRVLPLFGALVGIVSISAAPGPRSSSFFDPLDRIDARRWYVSDGWVNGAMQGCIWAAENVKTSAGIMQLSLTKAPNRLRPYKCAEIRTHARLGYGLYEARIRTAAGSGLNTAMFTYSGPPLTKVHDEIDFEFLGKVPQRVQTNYFTAARGGHEAHIPLGTSGAAAFNRYAFEWLPGSMKWYVNGRLVRTVSGTGQPSVPGQFFLTLWSGTTAVDGWLGKFDASHLPVSAQVDWVAFTAAGEQCRFRESISCAR